MSKPAILSTVVLAVLFAVLVLLAWQYKNAGLLLFGGALFFSSLAIAVKRCADYLLPVIFSLATLAVFEYVIPYFTEIGTTSTVVKSDSASGNYSRFIKGYGYLPNPGVHTVHKFTHTGETIYNVNYTIGADGYRKPPYGSASTNNYLHGGSYAFGEGLDDNQTLAYFLWKNHNIAVKSVTFSGQGVHQALFNMQNGISPEQGINILLTNPRHALRSACKLAFTGGTPKYISDNGYAKPAGTCPKRTLVARVLNKSNTLTLAKEVLFNEAVIENEDMELYFAIIKTIWAESRKNNSKLLIAFMKVKDSNFANTDWTNESIMQRLADISDAVIDVTLSPKRETLDSSYYLHELDQHPTAAANKARARLIAEQLARMPE